MHEGKHGILDDVDDMDALYGKDKHDHDHDSEHDNDHEHNHDHDHDHNHKKATKVCACQGGLEIKPKEPKAAKKRKLFGRGK